MPSNLYYKGLQLPQLRSFCVVAKQSNFTAAAKTLGLSAPTVWQQVRALERELGASLIRRRGRAIELTPEGKVLLDLVQPWVGAMDTLPRVFAGKRAGLPRQVSAVSTHYLLSYHLPEPVRDFHKRHPADRLILRAALAPDVVRSVARAEVDLGIAPYDRNEPRDAALQLEDLFEMRLMLLTAVGHPLARKRRLSPADLVEHPIILPPRESYAYKTMERLLRREGLFERLQPVMETFSLDIVRKYVELGVGIALNYVGPGAEKYMPGTVIRLFDPKLEGLPVAIWSLKGAVAPAPAEEFRHILRARLGAG
jgi:DNA-binding transcriptional LysR family regulator